MLLIKRIAALVVGAGVLRIEPDRLAQIGDGAVEVAVAAECDAAIVVDARVFGIEADRLVVVGDGGFAIALVVMGVAAVAEGVGIGRIEAYRRVKIGDGVLIIPLLVIDAGRDCRKRARIAVTAGSHDRNRSSACTRSPLARQASPRLL